MSVDPAMLLDDSVPSPLEMREMLEKMAIKELMGPAGGEEEEVDERIRDRYLVGILAPRHKGAEIRDTSTAGTTAPSHDDDDDYFEGDFPPDDELAVEGFGRGSLSGSPCDQGGSRAQLRDCKNYEVRPKTLFLSRSSESLSNFSIRSAY